MVYTIFLDMEPYLAQWYKHERGGEEPVRLVRGSAESLILELFLQKQPEGSVPQLRAEPGQLEIRIPDLKYKDVNTYNYLPKYPRTMLHETIRNLFQLQLLTDYLKLSKNISKNNRIRQDLLIKAWMEDHEIVYDDTNYNTVKKILDRMRERERKRVEYNNKKKKSK